jgi:GTPase SAR1 family protein
MADDALRVLILGGESSGKTTLLEQLRSLAKPTGELLHGPAITVAPTTGQEVETIRYDASRFERRPPSPSQRSNLRRGAEGASDALPGAVEDSPASAKDTAAVSEPRQVYLSVKEFGGRMMSVWPRYIAGSDCGRVLIYIVDASSPTTIPTCAVELFNVLANCGYVAGGKVLVCVNKVTCPSAVRPEDIIDLFCLRDIQRAHPECDLAVLEIDTWSGCGLAEVLLWLSHAAGPKPSQSIDSL